MSEEALKIGLAPMEGVTDFATRLWFSKLSPPAFCWSPFYRATYTSSHVLPELYAPEIFQLQGYLPYFFIPQIMTGSVEDFCRVADHVLKFAPFVDLNCGCPSSKVVGRGSGSSVLESAEKFAALVEGISARIGAENLSVKMRLGYNCPEELPHLVESIRSVKLKRLTIHGRTRPQRYTGRADWNAIGYAAARKYFPVAGSGDIFSREIAATRMSQDPPFDALLIGRGALRNPWIFNEIRLKSKQTMNIEILIYALTVFALLQEVQKKSPPLLFEMSKMGHFISSINHTEEAWKDFYFQITRHSLNDLELSGFAFARLKMLWNSLRTSLPATFFTPEPLRAKKFSEWHQAVRNLSLKAPSSWYMQHQPEHDWLLSGQKATEQQ